MNKKKLKRPHFSEKDAAKIALEHYAVEATVRQLPSERDQNFHLAEKTGRELVLKISHSAEQKEVLDFQNQVMQLLVDKDDSLSCPKIIEATSGEQIREITGKDGCKHLVRMLTYLRGDRLVDIKRHSPLLLRSLGRFLARMDKALAQFSHPAMNRNFMWDIKRAATTIKTRLMDIDSSHQRDLVERFLSNFEKEAAPVLPQLRTSVIHNDANDYNVLVDGAVSKKVSGIIDFGDLIHTYTVAELAIACAYAMLGKKDPINAAVQIVKGYHEEFPVTESELEVLFRLICIRLCTSVAISAERKKLAAQNKYLKISEKPAWELLEYLASVNSQFVHDTFRNASDLLP